MSTAHVVPNRVERFREEEEPDGLMNWFDTPASQPVPVWYPPTKPGVPAWAKATIAGVIALVFGTVLGIVLLLGIALVAGKPQDQPRGATVTIDKGKVRVADGAYTIQDKERP